MKNACVGYCTILNTEHVLQQRHVRNSAMILVYAVISCSKVRFWQIVDGRSGPDSFLKYESPVTCRNKIETNVFIQYVKKVRDLWREGIPDRWIEIYDLDVK